MCSESGFEERAKTIRLSTFPIVLLSRLEERSIIDPAELLQLVDLLCDIVQLSLRLFQKPLPLFRCDLLLLLVLILCLRLCLLCLIVMFRFDANRQWFQLLLACGR